ADLHSFRDLPLLLLLLTAAGLGAPGPVIVTDEAEAVLRILERRQAGKSVDEESGPRACRHG
ncbi:MAG: hypothetical protein ACREM9_09775, partial [Gemmatimonadales bacterium]